MINLVPNKKQPPLLQEYKRNLCLHLIEINASEFLHEWFVGGNGWVTMSVKILVSFYYNSSEVLYS